LEDYLENMERKIETKINTEKKIRELEEELKRTERGFKNDGENMKGRKTSIFSRSRITKQVNGLLLLHLSREKRIG